MIFNSFNFQLMIEDVINDTQPESIEDCERLASTMHECIEDAMYEWISSDTILKQYIDEYNQQI